MKKLLFILLGVTFTTLTFAQTEPKKVEEKQLRKDIRGKREENKETVKDASRLKLKDAKEEHKDSRVYKKAQKRHATALKRKGVKHPVSRAKHQIHAQDEARKYQ
jgi:hypothetical protein